VDEECSEASGVAKVAGVAGFGGVLAAIIGGPGSEGTIVVLLQQPMEQWHGGCRCIRKIRTLRISSTSVTRQTHANPWPK
jgi:hypothetical protein